MGLCVTTVSGQGRSMQGNCRIAPTIIERPCLEATLRDASHISIHLTACQISWFFDVFQGWEAKLPSPDVLSPVVVCRMEHAAHYMRHTTCRLLHAACPYSSNVRPHVRRVRYTTSRVLRAVHARGVHCSSLASLYACTGLLQINSRCSCSSPLSTSARCRASSTSSRAASRRMSIVFAMRIGSVVS